MRGIPSLAAAVLAGVAAVVASQDGDGDIVLFAEISARREGAADVAD